MRKEALDENNYRQECDKDERNAVKAEHGNLYFLGSRDYFYFLNYKCT
jgi:hypothetical protein